VKETAAMLRLDGKLDRKPSTLSGGEQQRVALGRSLIRRPKILLLDEPLTNLDAKLRHDMRAELKRLHRQFGLTIVYATPDELEALSMGEEVAVMRNGGVVQIGTPDELYETPRDLYVAGKIGSPR
jgi:ABC-type sugar transport system ATPase subunit